MVKADYLEDVRPSQGQIPSLAAEAIRSGHKVAVGGSPASKCVSAAAGFTLPETVRLRADRQAQAPIRRSIHIEPLYQIGYR